jgi:hypothetical protein
MGTDQGATGKPLTGEMKKKLDESTGRACAVMAAAAFAMILEADQIEAIQKGTCWRTLMYCLLGGAIPINLLMYDHFIERGIRREWRLLKPSRGWLVALLVYLGWSLAGGGLLVAICLISTLAGCVFAVFSIASSFFYTLYRPSYALGGSSDTRPEQPQSYDDVAR